MYNMGKVHKVSKCIFSILSIWFKALLKFKLIKQYLNIWNLGCVFDSGIKVNQYNVINFYYK